MLTPVQVARHKEPGQPKNQMASFPAFRFSAKQTGSVGVHARTCAHTCVGGWFLLYLHCGHNTNTTYPPPHLFPSPDGTMRMRVFSFQPCKAVRSPQTSPFCFLRSAVTSAVLQNTWPIKPRFAFLFPHSPFPPSPRIAVGKRIQRWQRLAAMQQ